MLLQYPCRRAKLKWNETPRPHKNHTAGMATESFSKSRLLWEIFRILGVHNAVWCVPLSGQYHTCNVSMSTAWDSKETVVLELGVATKICCKALQPTEKERVDYIRGVFVTIAFRNLVLSSPNTKIRVRKIKIFSFVLYGYETWSQNTPSNRQQRKLQNDKFSIFVLVKNTMWMVKSSMM